MNSRDVRCAFLMAALAAAACNKQENSDKPIAEPQAASQQPEQRAEKAEQPALWPDGWMVVSEDEWIPVMNAAGRELSAARQSFVANDLTGAREHVQAAAKAIRQEQGELKTEPQEESANKRLDDAAKQLGALAAKLDDKQQVTREEFERTFTSAYRTNAQVDWLHLSTDTLVPLFEKPRTHFADALRKLADKDQAGAAAELRRGTAYLRLATESARKEDKTKLDDALGELRRLASRADKGELAEADLRSALARVDSAYATSYLDRAQDELKRDARPQAGRSLREAATRMRARLEWIGDQTKDAAKDLVDELEQTGDQLAKGGKLAGKKLEELYARAKKSLTETPSEEHPGHRG